MLLLRRNMFASTSKPYFILALIVLATTISAEDKECVVIDKMVNLTCNVAENLIQQDNGKLTQHLCACYTAFIKANLSYCQADSYDFAHAPECGKFIHSKEFIEISGNRNELSDYLINVLFKDILGICSEKNEKIAIKSVKSVFKDGSLANGLEAIILTAFPTDVASLVTQCYKEVRKLANIST